MKLSKEELLRERSRILGYGAAELGKANIALTKEGRDVAVGKQRELVAHLTAEVPRSAARSGRVLKKYRFWGLILILNA